MFDPIDSRYPYSVICSTTASPRPSSWSQHYSLAGAIRYARAISGIGKRGVPNLLSCKIWCKRSNRLMSVETAEKES